MVREGIKQTVGEEELVVGDLIYLREGMKVPVDGIMVKGHTLRVSERYVHGEAHPSPKRPVESSEPLKSCPILLAQANVTGGCGWVVAIITGD